MPARLPLPLLPHRRAFGEAVRTRRGELGLSQEALGEKACLDQTYLSGIETGRRNPSLDVLVRLAAALELPLSTLVGRMEIKDPDA